MSFPQKTINLTSFCAGCMCVYKCVYLWIEILIHTFIFTCPSYFFQFSRVCAHDHTYFQVIPDLNQNNAYNILITQNTSPFPLPRPPRVPSFPHSYPSLSIYNTSYIILTIYNYIYAMREPLYCEIPVRFLLAIFIIFPMPTNVVSQALFYFFVCFFEICLHLHFLP